MKKSSIIILLIILAVVFATALFFYSGGKRKGGPSLNLKDIPDTPINKICLKISQPDDLYYCLAVANQDMSFCEYLDMPGQRKLCQGMAARDVSYCREIQEPGAKKMCYYELSFLTGEFDYCDETENPNDCYFAFIHRLHWESRADEIKAEYCEKINNDTTEGKIFKNCCLAFKGKNPSLCQGNKFCLSFFKQPLSFCDTSFETPEGLIKDKDDCLVDRAMSERNPSICEKINDDEVRDMCYGNMSTHIFPDISLCEKITDEMRKNMCYAEVAIHFSEESANKARLCLNSGGTISTGLCCQSTGDFPNSCAVGACGCAPEYSHEVKVCDCGKDKCFDGFKCTTREEAEIPPSYHIENPPYYREDYFCWGASAIMLMMNYGLSENEIQEFRTILKSGRGGPPDMFMGFKEFGVLDKIRIAYSKNYSKEAADFYNRQLLIKPDEQVIILADENEALERLKKLISSDILVMIIGHHGNHYMIVTGYDKDYIYINDPGIDKEFLQKVSYQSEYQEKTKMSVENFFEQWTVSGFEGGERGISFPGDYGMIWLEK